MTERHYATPFDQAYDIGCALLAQRVGGPLAHTNIDMDDERQEWAAHLVHAITRYDPSKGAVSTWTYTVFRHWLWTRVQWRKELWDNELPTSPLPGTAEDGAAEVISELDQAGAWLYDSEPTADWTDEAHELLELLPEKVQAVAALAWGEGYGTVMVSEHLGCTRRTVNRHMAQAEAFVEELRAA